MGFRENVKADIRLRNLTIYAQWASILGAITLYLRNFALVLYALLGPPSFRLNIQGPLDMLLTIASWCLFPLAVLALELPQYMRQKPCFYASMATQITVHVYSIYFASIHLGNDGRRFWELVSYLLLFMATSSVLPQIWAHGSPPGPASRAVVNALYFGDLIMPFLVYRITLPWNAWEKLDWSTKCAYLVGYVNASMFGIAALLYGIAWTRRHAWVPSRSLGGSGIEPMVLMMPGRGPLYQSIGDEAGEGVIRLV